MYVEAQGHTSGQGGVLLPGVRVVSSADRSTLGPEVISYTWCCARCNKVITAHASQRERWMRRISRHKRWRHRKM